MIATLLWFFGVVSYQATSKYLKKSLSLYPPTAVAVGLSEGEAL